MSEGFRGLTLGTEKLWMGGGRYIHVHLLSCTMPDLHVRG